MQTNNYVPTIISRGARRAVRYVCSGERTLRYFKKVCHRAYRRMMNQQLNDISGGIIDPEDYNDEPGHHKCTSWDIW